MTFFICVLAAVGSLLLLAGLWALLLLPVKSRDFVLLLGAQGDGGSLEQHCRTYLLLQGMGILRRELVIVDRGLSPDGRRLAERLAETYPRLRLTALELPEELFDTETDHGRGTKSAAGRRGSGGVPKSE